MLTAILDTNVFLRAAFRTRSPSAKVLDAYLADRFQLVVSHAILDEILNVLILPDIRARHGWSDEEILEFLTKLPARAALYPGQAPVPPSIPRDVSDVKFLSVAHESKANYLVTKDGRHLLRLKKFRATKIVTPSQFLRVLA